MPEQDLIAETNQLLKRILELDEEGREETKRAREGLKEQLEQSRAEREKQMNAKLLEAGAEPEMATGTEEEWIQRQQAAREEGKRRQEEIVELDRKYKADLLSELQAQTELLRKIAEKLNV